MQLVRGADLTFTMPDDYRVGTPVHRRLDPRYEYLISEQAIRTPGAAGPTMGADASVGGVSPTYLAGSPGPGGGDMGPVVSISTGANAAGRAHWGLGNGAIVHSFNASYDFMYYRALIAVIDLSEAAEEYDTWFGFGDVVVSSTQTDGAQWIYNRDGLGTNWHVINRAAAAGAAVDTGIPVVTNSAHEFIVSWTPAGGVKYWYDGVVVANLTNNIPGTSNVFGAGAGILKSAGVGSRNIICAYQEVYARWSTPRGLALPAELT